MISSRPPSFEMRAVLPATLDAIEPFFVEFRSRHRDRCSRADIYAAELLLREALTNAVVHGCRQDPTRLVRCTVRSAKGRVTIVVADDGPGFDWKKMAERCAKREAACGRGMEILRTYSTRVRFNAQGNSVMILKRFSRRGSLA